VGKHRARKGRRNFSNASFQGLSKSFLSPAQFTRPWEQALGCLHHRQI